MEHSSDSPEVINKEIVIKHDRETDLIQALLKNYELVWNRIENSSNRILQVVGVGFTLLGLLTGYILNRPPLPIISWIAPMVFLPLFAYIIYSIYTTTASLWNARFLSQRINYLLKEKAFIRHLPDSPEARFFSTKRGSWKFGLMYVIIFLTSGLLFVILSIDSFMVIYTKANHLQGILFVLVYAFAVTLLFVSCIGFLSDLPNAFQDVLRQYPHGEPIPIDRQLEGQLPLSGTGSIPIHTQRIGTKFRKVLAFLLPRTWDFIAKGFFFLFGLGAAFIIVGIPTGTIAGLPYNHLQLINALFGTHLVISAYHGRKQTPYFGWTSFSTVPLWAIYTLGLIYFFVEEVLLQQAKYIWDDMRDLKRDKALLHNEGRAITAGLISIRSAIWQIVGRLLLALILGYFLGGVALVCVFLLIVCHQIVYNLWAKPHAIRNKARGKHQLTILFVLSFNVFLRFLAGVVAIIGFQLYPLPIPIILLFGIFYFYSFGVLAAFWKIEADHYGTNWRPQSEYFQQRGVYCQHIGLILALLLSCVLFFSQIESILFALMSSGIILVITLLFVCNYDKFVKAHPIIKIIKSVAAVLLLLSNYIMFIAAILEKNNIFLLLSNLSLITNYLLLFEGMTYLEYNFEALKRRLPLIKLCWYAYLFQPNEHLGFKQLLSITFSDVNLDQLGIDKTDLEM